MSNAQQQPPQVEMTVYQAKRLLEGIIAFRTLMRAMTGACIIEGERILQNEYTITINIPCQEWDANTIQDAALALGIDVDSIKRQRN